MSQPTNKKVLIVVVVVAAAVFVLALVKTNENW
jgi:hypothetical protein